MIIRIIIGYRTDGLFCLFRLYSRLVIAPDYVADDENAFLAVTTLHKLFAKLGAPFIRMRIKVDEKNLSDFWQLIEINKFHAALFFRNRLRIKFESPWAAIKMKRFWWYKSYGKWSARIIKGLASLLQKNWICSFN